MKEKTTKKRAKLGRKRIKIEAEEIYDLAKSGLGIMDICRLCNKGKGIGWDLFKRLREDKNTGIARKAQHKRTNILFKEPRRKRERRRMERPS
jgi:hypothetical protein